MANILSSGGGEAITTFIYGRLFPELTKADCETKVNVERVFRDFLKENGAGILADEYSTKWMPNLLERVYKELEDWENLGLPRPMELTNYGLTFITWNHPKYRQVTGRDPLPNGFADLNDWIRQHTEHSFLFVCACFLKLLDADPIFVTDTSGDGGVDLIGRLHQGALRSTFLFVQAKTSKDRIGGDTVLLEYGKFLAQARSKTFDEYRKALCIGNSCDGASICYLFAANNEFQPAARRVAADLGVLLRSRRQVAYWLAARTSRSKLESLEASFSGALKANLASNIASQIRL